MHDPLTHTLSLSLKEHITLHRTKQETLSCLIILILRIGTVSLWHLALDRTNWKFGSTHINILMLGILYKDLCIPLLWTSLGKAGNSTNSVGALKPCSPVSKKEALILRPLI